MQVVAHNMLAQFAGRQLKITTGEKAKSAEKLSSGYRINRSADDAAGLQISEKMRYQIRGLNRASDNIQDGISLLQVADGALSEVSDMVHRLKELTVQGLNDTNAEIDIAAIQEEMSEILDEIDSIAARTTFNDIPLLEGDYIKTTKKTITKATEAMTVKSTYVTNAVLPSWAMINGKAANVITADEAKMIKNNPAVSPNAVQNTKLEKYVTDATAPGGIRVETNWTPELDNNYTAVIDFSALKSVNGTTDVQVDDDINGDGVIDASDTVTVNNIYQKLSELVNTGFTMNCCSCSKRYGILFTTRAAENEVLKWPQGENGNYGWNGDIPDYEKVYIDDLLALAEQNPNSGAEIAEKLVQKVLDGPEQTMDHFTHYTKDPDNEAALIMYDFRENETNVADITIDTEFLLRKVTEITIPEGTQDYTYYDTQVGLMIQTGFDEGDDLGIHLYDITSGGSGLGLRGKLNLLEKQYEYSTNVTTKKETISIQVPKYKTTYIPGYYNTHGEWNKPYTKREIDGYDKVEFERTHVSREEVLVGEQERKNDKCLDYIDEALEKLNTIRAKLGAQQNRLEHTQAIVNNTSENTTAAESRIRDTDMAEEMVTYSKHNILEQTGQSVLAQANQMQQGILTLLQ